MPDDSLTDELAGGVAGMVPVIGPVASPVFERVFKLLRLEYSRNTSRAIRAAVTVSGLSREDLAEAIEQDPKLIPLFARLLHTAGMTGHDEMLRTLGATFGIGVRERSRIDEAEMLLIAAGNLTPLHISVLRLVAAAPPNESGHPACWPTNVIVEHSQLSESFAAICAIGLSASGLFVARDTYDGTAYEVTDLGAAMIEALDRLASQ